MQVINLNCPNCGAPIQAEAGARYTVCPYCSSNILVDDGVQHVQYDNAEQAGYDFERGRQRAREEQGYTEPQKKHTALWVLGWIFCFPIPVTVLVVRSKKLHMALKAAIIVVVWAAYFGLALYGEKSDTAKQANSSQTVVTQEADETGHLTLFPL